MGNFFKNKFFIVLLIVACVLTLSTIALNLSGRGSIVTDAVNLILDPFQRFAAIVKESFSGFAGYFTEFGKMKDELEELRAKLEEAESQLEENRRLREENEMFMSFYELKKKRPDYVFQDAKVTAKDPGNYFSALTINKGSLQTLGSDMPVVAARGTDIEKERYSIVGYVSEVGLLYAKVVPFIRTGSSIGAYIERTGEAVMVEGEFELEKSGLCRLVCLSKESSPEVGDKIYSSGNGNIYPEDLYIGEIVEVSSDPLSHTKTGHIKPAVNFDEIKNVMVILEYKRSFY
ncbi:MAG: rod shape-determining protein MreC [Oscillospiraceae bacterium]|nr:rod shape-determining protein MreC [Oscillospiraceae bacterium]